MKYALLFISQLMVISSLIAQKNGEMTDYFTIEGLVKQPITIHFDSLKNYPIETVDSVVITNHLGQRKSV